MEQRLLSSSSSSTTSSPSSSIDYPKPNPKRARTTKSRSSIYRGVTRHRWTGRFEAHLWDKTSWNPVQNKAGRQVYLGAYDNEDDAARTYDLAALKYWGSNTILNFPFHTYLKEFEEMAKMTKEEFLASLRRRSNGFSRGVSKYRGVARHHHNGRWEARIGRVNGNKYLYLGTFGTQEEAAMAYDMAAIEFRGRHAVTNFDINKYAHVLKNFPSNEQSQHEHEANSVPPPHEATPISILPAYQRDENQAALPDNQQGCEEDDARAWPDHQECENQAIQESTTLLLDPISTINSHVALDMDQIQAHKHLWDDLCLDVEFDNFAIPNIPMKRDPDVLDCKGFEDNIEFIFDGPVNDSEVFLQDALSRSDGCNVEATTLALDALSSPSSSSTMTSVCSNM